MAKTHKAKVAKLKAGQAAKTVTSDAAKKGAVSQVDQTPAVSIAPTHGKHWDAKFSHKVIHTVVTILITLVVIGGGLAAYIYFVQDTQTTISNDNAKPIVSTIKAPDAARAHFDEAVFQFDLPSDWKRLQPDIGGPYTQYKYQAGKKNAENRFLSIYVDKLPLTMAVNKEVAVDSNGSGITHGDISDNCTTFTAKPAASVMSEPAKWDGVSFLCDMAAVTRNVAGTSSPGAVNRVDLTDAGFTKHSFFFVYEDDNYNPDYTIFYDMLNSFSVK